MSRQLPDAVVRVGDRLTAIAGSYLHTVTDGDWQACRTCCLPVLGRDRCPQCATHLRLDIPLADRTGYLIYADMPSSQAYRMMHGYKEAVFRAAYEDTVQALLALGLRAHFACAEALAEHTRSGWAVVPSTKGRSVLIDLVRGLARNRDAEVIAEPAGVAPLRSVNPASWRIDARSELPDHIVVIDDAWVTGASSQSLAASLKQAGVGQVSILSVARVLSPAWDANPPFVKNVLPTLAFDWTICPWTRGACPAA